MYRRFVRLPLVVLAALAPLAAQPVIKQLQNNYSYILPGLPNYGIAEGSIFIIGGTGLANGSTGLQTGYPLPTSLLGTSVSVTVNGVATTPILYYVLPTQLAAILPSATPVGTGTITVTNNGQTSAPAPIQVVQSAFGILTYYGTGSGFAAAFDAAFPASAPHLGLTSSANPGEVLTLWGSGIGPDPGNPDETIPQQLNNLQNALPVEVDIGGIPSTILYAGRSIYPGLDQINVYIPSNVTPGCHVSLVVRTGNYVSNSTTLEIAQSGRTCSDPNIAYTASELERLTAQSNIKVGVIGIGRAVTAGKVESGISAGFYNYPVQEFLTQAQSPSYGSCVIVPAVPVPPFLDPGNALRVTGPNAETVTIDKNSSGYFDSSLGTNFIPATGGTFTVTNAAGGANVGALTASITIPPPLTWTNMNSISAVTRAQGVPISWSNSAPNTYVRITGSSTTADGSQTVQFECSAPSSAGQFTVPASTLLALPSSTGGQLTVFSYSLPGSFTASGLDAGIIVGEINFGITVTYR